MPRGDKVKDILSLWTTSTYYNRYRYISLKHFNFEDI
jgi:hypothetical protein